MAFLKQMYQLPVNNGNKRQEPLIRVHTVKSPKKIITLLEVIAPLNIFSVIFDVVVEVAGDGYGKNESCANPERT